MVTSSSSSGLTFKLHPLVVVNISDHVTRAKVSSGAGGGNDEATALACVAGCLLGTVGAATRTVDVANSFELVVAGPGEHPDAALLRRRLDQYKQTFPALDLVGWYAVGALASPPGGPGTTPATVHDALSPAEGSEVPAPFGLIFDPAALSSSSTSSSSSASAVRTSVAGLPIRLWEWVPVGSVDGGGASPSAPAPSASAAPADAAPSSSQAAGGGSWAEAPFTIDSSEIERIGVAQAARAVPAGADESGTDQLVGHFKSLHTAVSTMASRIEAIRAAVAAMASGEREVDRGTVRAAAALLKSARNIGGGGASTPSSSSAAAATAEADALAMLLLASATRGIAASASLVEAVAAGAPKAVPEPPAQASAQRGGQGGDGGGRGGGGGGGGGRPHRQRGQQHRRDRDRARDSGSFERGSGGGGGRRRGGSGGDAFATMVS